MSLNSNDSYTSSSAELNMRYEALKKAGFDDATALNCAHMYSSVDEAIDSLLCSSLSANKLSGEAKPDGRPSSTALSTVLPTTSANQISTAMSTAQMSTAMTKPINSLSSNNMRNLSACESLSLKLISDIDNCLESIHESDRRQSLNSSKSNVSNSSVSFNNFNVNKSCDIDGPNANKNSISLFSRSISPQNLYGYESILKPKTSGQNTFSIDLNKEKLGSHIVPNDAIFGTTGSHSTLNTSSALNPKKTFADIASSNTKKAVQPPKSTRTVNANVKSCDNMKTKEIDISRLLRPIDASNKLSSLESFSTAEVMSSGEALQKPTNLMAYKGLWVCNISPEANYNTLKSVFRKYGNFLGIQTFERKATNGSNIVFVHYDNPQSPVDAIAELWGIYRKDICIDEYTPLKLRFTPSMDQTKNGELPTMEKAKRVVEKSGECFNWRLSSGCHREDRCLYKHILINKAIDSQPWAKLKRQFATGNGYVSLGGINNANAVNGGTSATGGDAGFAANGRK